MTLSVSAGTRIYLALEPTDMRKGFDGLAAQVNHVLRRDPFSGHLFLFRGKRWSCVT
jgi:transposase